ncbi:energy transducer TonB [Flavobacterium sp.]|uniref:energy transducer TonB n=1 Tax=Flavobacterium sp. TaxID=239 RepID=UPI004047387C
MKSFYFLILFSVMTFGQNSDVDGYGKGEVSVPIYSNSFHQTSNGQNKFHLSGRIIEKSDFIFSDLKCDEVGKIVIQVKVNKEGRVIMVQVTRGSTNSSSCLIKASIDKAKIFKWKEDKNAPDIQIGYIVFDFKQEIP